MLQMNARNVRKLDSFMILMFCGPSSKQKKLRNSSHFSKDTAGKIDIFSPKFSALRSERSQTDIEDADQCDPEREACQDQSFAVFQHFSKESMRGQIQKSAADIRHKQAKPKARGMRESEKTDCSAE